MKTMSIARGMRPAMLALLLAAGALASGQAAAVPPPMAYAVASPAEVHAVGGLKTIDTV